MSREQRGRIAPSPPPLFAGAAPQPPGIYPWNKPRPAINPHGGESPISSEEFHERQQAAVNALARSVALKEREAWQVECSEWHLSASGIQSHINTLPVYLRQSLLNQIDWVGQRRPSEQRDAFISNTILRSVQRLERVRQAHAARSSSNELGAYWFRRWSHLAEQTRRQVLTWANTLAAQISEMFFTECRALNTQLEEIGDDDLLWLYRHLGREVRALRIRPPFWRSLNKRFDKLLCLSALGRLMSADWWGRQIWRLRNDWRECQLRAIGQIHKRRNPYVSQDALSAWQEQRRKNRQFIANHELEDDEGNVASLEAMALASVSNPAIRRHELMARMMGVEQVAMSRGDVGLFLTITCPSRYHSNNHSGHANPKWDGATPSVAQKYLCRVWGRATAKLKRSDLRPYGFRVAEPHHDSTPHWHVLIFLPPDQVKPALEILRDYFTREDRAELGKNTAARFKAKKMDPKMGGATAYIAKYISKNIDGYALDSETDKETGRPLRETARLAMAWASQHRIRQFQPVGQPPVTVYRELRKLSNQLTSIMIKAGTYKRGASLLPDPVMDAVAAAADVGCFATYIQKQGGVLIPRERYAVRVAYENSDEPNAYGETTRKITGVWSPHIGEDSRQCTRLKTWTIRKKQPVKPSAGFDSDFFESQDGPAAPWSSVNNSTGDQKISNLRELSTELPAEKLRDPTSLTRLERRAVLIVMRSSCRGDKKAQNLPAAPPAGPPITDELAAAVITLCATQGMAYTPDLSMALIRGARIRLDDNREAVLRNGNELEIRKVRRWCSCGSELNAVNPSTGAGCYRCANDDVLSEWL
ncbi:replication endonuclease [Pantoea agglomerans]|uniref:replication endonuclease n=1 Tax=Enterobacter agglomerans TaxID=549 RepID=UPI0028C3DCC0|nr:replication endonuclease [Pantoea agglomerans]WNN32983.1 replication endonuclease [Pantoea agglomerans]